MAPIRDTKESADKATSPSRRGVSRRPYQPRSSRPKPQVRVRPVIDPFRPPKQISSSQEPPLEISETPLVSPEKIAFVWLEETPPPASREDQGAGMGMSLDLVMGSTGDDIGVASAAVDEHVWHDDGTMKLGSPAKGNSGSDNELHTSSTSLTRHKELTSKDSTALDADPGSTPIAIERDPNVSSASPNPSPVAVIEHHQNIAPDEPKIAPVVIDLTGDIIINFTGDTIIDLTEDEQMSESTDVSTAESGPSAMPFIDLPAYLPATEHPSISLPIVFIIQAVRKTVANSPEIPNHQTLWHYLNNVHGLSRNQLADVMKCFEEIQTSNRQLNRCQPVMELAPVLDIFHFFPQLPTEIRLMIFNFALSEERISNTILGPGYFRALSAKVPHQSVLNIAKVCHDARSVVMKVFQKSAYASEALHTHSFLKYYFFARWDTDVFYQCRSYPSSFFQIPKKYTINAQRIAFDIDFVSLHNPVRCLIREGIELLINLREIIFVISIERLYEERIKTGLGSYLEPLVRIGQDANPDHPLFQEYAR